MLTTLITRDHLPTPDLALRSGVDHRDVRAFADHSAEAAQRIHQTLAATWSTTSAARRVHALELAYAKAIEWRTDLAAQGGIILGTSITTAADRFTVPITDTEPNCDRLGHCGRFRHDARHNPDNGTYTGGTDTPASLITERYGHLIETRFTAEQPNSDILDNLVRLPDGDLIVGNRLTRGAAAEMTAQHLAARVAARGIDTTGMETGGHAYYAITASEDARTRIRDAAFRHAATDPHTMTRRAWWEVAYLLYQAPQNKKGSDAVTRVFLAALSALLCRTTPRLRHDIDLWCMTAGQPAVLTAGALA